MSESSLTAGVDLGGTKIQTVIVSGEGVIGRARVPTPATNADDVMMSIAETVRSSLDTAGRKIADLRAVGIGSPGDVDSATGRVRRAANVAGFADGVDLGPTVSGALGVQVVVDNDVRAATVGEHQRGAGRPFRDMLGVFVGTGVGGGLILDGELRRGHGSAGEIGHTVVRVGGRRCRCGRRGCLEAYAGSHSINDTARRRRDSGARTSLFDIAQRKGRSHITSDVLADAFEAGDELAVALIGEAVDALGVALGSAQNLLDLDAIVLGGGLTDELGEPFVRRVEEAMRPHLFAADRPPRVLRSELGELSGAVGAAVIAGG